MITEFFYDWYKSPIGIIKVQASQKGLTSVRFTEENTFRGQHSNDYTNNCIEQLDAYFAGKLKQFYSLRLCYSGSSFQLDVWESLLKVPFGEKMTYGELAGKIGAPKAARAVGNALRANPLQIIIPCHRIIKRDNQIGQYAAGADKKKWLLEHEKDKASFISYRL